MKTRLEQVLEWYLNGREIAVWGTPTRLLYRVLKPYRFQIADIVDPIKHFVVAVTEDDLKDFFMDEQSEPFNHVVDCLAFNDLSAEFPFEWECHGVKIGKLTYFGEAYAQGCEYGYIESIGHYTSISSTALIQHDHQMSMVFTSDDIQEIFTKENLALFKSKQLADPKYRKKRTKIGNDVWIGAHSFINASKVASIGDGAIIGTGAVVLEDVPPYAVVVGVPAKIKRYRFTPEIIEILLRIKWWEWPFDKINENTDALISPEIFIERFGHY